MGEWGKDDISLSSQMPNNFSLRVNQLTSEMTSAFSNMCTRLIAITAQKKIIQERTLLDFNRFVIFTITKYSLQGTTQGRYLTGGVPPVRFSM